MDNENTLRLARERVAARYAHDYLKRSILRGEWDTGHLVRDAYAEIEAEQEKLAA